MSPGIVLLLFGLALGAGAFVLSSRLTSRTQARVLWVSSIIMTAGALLELFRS